MKCYYFIAMAEEVINNVFPVVFYNQKHFFRRSKSYLRWTRLPPQQGQSFTLIIDTLWHIPSSTSGVWIMTTRAAVTPTSSLTFRLISMHGLRHPMYVWFSSLLLIKLIIPIGENNPFQRRLIQAGEAIKWEITPAGNGLHHVCVVHDSSSYCWCMISTDSMAQWRLLLDSRRIRSWSCKSSRAGTLLRN